MSKHRLRVIKTVSGFIAVAAILSMSGCAALAVGGAVVSVTTTAIGAGVAVGSAAVGVTTEAVKAVIP